MAAAESLIKQHLSRFVEAAGDLVEVGADQAVNAKQGNGHRVSSVSTFPERSLTYQSTESGGMPLALPTLVTASIWRSWSLLRSCIVLEVS